MCLRISVIFVFVFCSSFFAHAQTESTNPFDLTPRIEAEKAARKAAGDLSYVPDNPFDIVRTAEGTDLPDLPEEELTPEKIEYINLAAERENFNRFFFSVFLTLLILFTLSFALFRHSFAKAWRSFLNQNILTQVHREQGSIAHFAYVLMNVLFCGNLALFIMLTAREFGFGLPGGSNISAFIILFGGITGVFILKHLLLKVTAHIFPVRKEVKLYAFTITVFCAVLGFILIPLNVFIAYAPAGTSVFVIWLTLGIIILTYLFRCLRGFFIGARWFAGYLFHFLLYICAVEIAPALILVRFVLNQG